MNEKTENEVIRVEDHDKGTIAEEELKMKKPTPEVQSGLITFPDNPLRFTPPLPFL